MGAIKRMVPDIEEMTTNKAEDIAEQRYGREFYDLPNSLQFNVWMEAEQAVAENLMAQAEARMDDLKIRQMRLGK